MKTQLTILLLLLFLGACKKDIVSSTLKVTTSYKNGTLYGTESSQDSVVRGFVLGIYDGKQVSINNNTDVITLPSGKGDFSIKPELKPNTQYAIWAFAYHVGQEDKMETGNIIAFKTN